MRRQVSHLEWAAQNVSPPHHAVGSGICLLGARVCLEASASERQRFHIIEVRTRVVLQNIQSPPWTLFPGSSILQGVCVCGERLRFETDLFDLRRAVLYSLAGTPDEEAVP